MTVSEDATAQQSALDLDRVRAAVERQADRVTEGIDDMVRHLAAQVADESHREVKVPVVSGGAHWAGGLWISAAVPVTAGR